jgi:hypothetical protein
MGQLFFEFVVDLLGIGFDGVIGTAHPAVEIDASSGSLDGQRTAAGGTGRLDALH